MGKIVRYIKIGFNTIKHLFSLHGKLLKVYLCEKNEYI